MKCVHGYESGGSDSIYVDSDSTVLRAVERHERKCRSGRIFYHSSWIFFKVVCCDGCGKKIIDV